MSPHSILRRGGQIILAALLFFFSIEICARIDDVIRYEAPFWEKYTSERLRNREGGMWVNVPNARFENCKNNNLGFRGPNMSPTKQLGTVRVVCLGASESYGSNASPDKEWPAQLRQMLPPGQYEVINASVAGIGLPAYEKYLKKHLLPLTPDLVIMLINPLFYVHGFEVFGPPSEGHGEAKKTAPKEKYFPLVPIIKENLRSLPKLKNSLKGAVANNFPHLLRKYQLWASVRQMQEAERIFLKGSKPKDFVPAPCLEQFREDLTRLVTFLRSQNIQVLLTTYPHLMDHHNFRDYPDLHFDARRFSATYSFEGMIDALEKLNAAISQIAGQEKILFLDADALVPRTTAYFTDNVHYLDSGAKLIAEAVAAQVLSNSVTPAAVPRIGSEDER